MEKEKEEFLRLKHLEYIDNLEKHKSLYSIGFYVRNHLRMGGAYWAVTSLTLLKKEIEEDKKNELISWIKSCQNEDGGFGGNTGHDSHITNTLYALLVLIQFDSVKSVNTDKIIDYIRSLYVHKTGAFMGDRFGEIDTRFVYSALYIFIILKNKVPEKSFEFLERCLNEDGGIGGQPQVESHAAYVFCGISALGLLNKLKDVSLPKIKQFLATRQTKTGGFNGRPEKLPDLCYSWWVLSSLYTVNESLQREGGFHSNLINNKKNNPNKNNLLTGINTQKLEEFILSCQDEEDGGMSDRPGNTTDIFHTFFGLAALSLIDHEKYNLEEIDALFAIPKKLTKNLRLRINK